MNNTVILGNLTRDPELKFTQSNKAVCSFTVAHNSKYKAGDGTMKEDVIYLECEAWNNTAETIAKHYTKGRKILVEGFLKQETWEDKNGGGKRSKIKLKVERFHFVDSKRDANTEQAPMRVNKPAPSPPNHEPYAPIDESDIPFHPQHHFA